jgi:hypothetical protein
MTTTDHNGFETVYPDVIDSRPMPVSFAERADQELSHEWATRGLTWLYANRRNVFADMMLAIVSAEKSTSRGRK